MKNYQTELKWAGIFFVVYLAWMVIEHICGLHDRNIQYQQLVSTFILIPSLLIYFLTILEKKREAYQGTITFKQAFKSGLLLTVFIVLLSPLNQLITTQVIAPEYFENMQEYAVAQKRLSPQEAEAQLNTGAFMVQSVVGGMVTGVVFSGVVAMVMRNKKTTTS